MRWLLFTLLLLVVSPLLYADEAVERTLARLESGAGVRVLAHFLSAGVEYPPRQVQLIALKESRRLELWAYDGEDWRYVHDYAIFAASGEAGPKLREGDRQVPEGFYRIVELNPNSNFHLSLKLNYPNSFDWAQALSEGRSQPGSNIFIHGSAWSVGCLAVGNRYVEELFYLAGELGLDRVGVMILPYDFRRRPYTAEAGQPAWVADLYAYLNLRLQSFPLEEKRTACVFGCSGSAARADARP